MTASKKLLDSSSIIKMNNQTIKELRAIAKERGLKGYYKLRKADLITLLETPQRPPRRPGQKKALGKVTMLPKPEEMDSFELNEMTKSRSVVKSKLNEWYDWLVGYVPKSIKEPVSSAFSKVKSKVMRLYEGAKKTLKGEVEEEAKKEHNEQDHAEGPVEHKQAMNGAYKSFRLDGRGKTDVNSYLDLVKPRVCELIEEQVKTLDSAKVQMHLWVMWKKPVEMLIRLTPEEMEEAQDLDSTEDNFDRKMMVFNSQILEVFQGSDIDGVVESIAANLRTQSDNPKLPKSGFTIDHIMHLDIDFHKLELTRGSSYIELPQWIAMKKAVINPQNKDEECFKWAVIAALHHEEINNNPERITKLKPFAERYNWGGLEFPVALNKIGKFEKNNPEIAVNVLFASQKSIYIAHRSDYNSKRRKQANLLMIVDGENRHYTAVKSLSRLLKSMNATHKGAYHFCVNCLNGFRTESARDKHYKYCSSHGEVTVKMSEEKDKWLKFHDGQCQFKVPFKGTIHDVRRL